MGTCSSRQTRCSYGDLERRGSSTATRHVSKEKNKTRFPSSVLRHLRLGRSNKRGIGGENSNLVQQPPPLGRHAASGRTHETTTVGSTASSSATATAATAAAATATAGLRRPFRKSNFEPSDPGLGPTPLELLRSGAFPYLSATCLAQAGRVCVLWREVSTQEELWKALCLRRWKGKHVPLLEAKLPTKQRIREEGVEDDRNSYNEDGVENDQEHEARDPRPLENNDNDGNVAPQDVPRNETENAAESLKNGLEDLVAEMSIREMKRRLQELGANPRRLGSCLEKDECVELLMGSLLLSREGLLRVGGQLPPWVSAMRGWRWSYHFANRDSRRCWLTIDDIVRSPWTLSFPINTSAATSPLELPTITCEFHRDFSYTAEWFHPGGLSWHFEDSHRCVKVADYPALVAARNSSWGWRLVNAHAVFIQQRPLPP